jgi:hypothetical protein
LEKVLEYLQISQKQTSVFDVSIHVLRKATWEVLVPIPYLVPASHKAILCFFIFGFISFAALLGWASMRA